jgi:hypothetical protein
VLGSNTQQSAPEKIALTIFRLLQLSHSVSWNDTNVLEYCVTNIGVPEAWLHSKSWVCSSEHVSARAQYQYILMMT